MNANDSTPIELATVPPVLAMIPTGMGKFPVVVGLSEVPDVKLLRVNG